MLNEFQKKNIGRRIRTRKQWSIVLFKDFLPYVGFGVGHYCQFVVVAFLLVVAF